MSNMLLAIDDSLRAYCSGDDSLNHFSEHTLAFDPSQFDEIVGEMSKCFERVVDLIKTGKNKRELAQLNFNFFRVTKDLAAKK